MLVLNYFEIIVILYECMNITVLFDNLYDFKITYIIIWEFYKISIFSLLLSLNI